MKDAKSYNQFCPVARAAEIVSSRWTLIVLRELLAGSTKFNELRNGLPRMSPTLLSRRLAELEDAGIVHKRKLAAGKGFSYTITESGKGLAPVVMTLGAWGQKYVIKELAKHELDPGLLMWDIHRRIDVKHFPEKSRFVVKFDIGDAPAARRNWWILVKDRETELCVHSPGHDVDVQVEVGLKTLTEIWMGKTPISDARKKNLMILSGSEKYVRSFRNWFSLSVFAKKTPLG